MGNIRRSAGESFNSYAEGMTTIDLENNMRAQFGEHLYKHMCSNPNIYVITADLGYILFDRIQKSFSERFFNTGASEQAALDIAVGMAQDGKIPFVYSITPFLLYRAFETIRTYINHEKVNVKMIGSGRNNDYVHDGFSHDATDDYLFMENFAYIRSCWPDNVEEMKKIIDDMLKDEYPYYLNLRR